MENLVAEYRNNKRCSGHGLLNPTYFPTLKLFISMAERPGYQILADVDI